MKYIFIILSELMILVNSGAKDFKLFPNLPLGEYRINFIASQQCNINQKSGVQFNFILFKTTRTATELRGNITVFNKAFDDSLFFHGSMAVKDKIGGWQSNAYVYNSPKAYTSLKKLLGGEFPKLLNSFGLNDTSEKTVKPGIYTTKGYDISNYPTNTNFPRQLFYGTYKMTVNYTEKNGDQYGCFTFTVEVKRPWEIE